LALYVSHGGDTYKATREIVGGEIWLCCTYKSQTVWGHGNSETEAIESLQAALLSCDDFDNADSVEDWSSVNG